MTAPAPLVDPKAGQRIYLSYTAAGRYDRCHFLQLTHKTKATDKAVDETPFFKGRVIHAATEQWLALRGTADLPALVPTHWAKEEAAVMAAGTVNWRDGQRSEVWTSAIEIAATLQDMLRALRVVELPSLVVEEKFSIEVGPNAFMFANADLLTFSPDGTNGYLVELKSGTSYDPKQCEWYIAVISRLPQFASVRNWYALPLRPAVSATTALVPVGQAQQQAQIDRVRTTVAAMHAGEWEPMPGSYCAVCEARSICPSYQATYGHIQRGQVGLG